MIDRQMWTGVLLTGAVMVAVILATIDLYLPDGFVAGTDDLATARTAGFTVLVLAQLINCLNCRSETVRAFSHVLANPGCGPGSAGPCCSGSGGQSGIPEHRLGTARSASLSG